MDLSIQELEYATRQLTACQADWERLIRKIWEAEPHKIQAILGIFDCKIKSGLPFREAFDYAASAYLESIGVAVSVQDQEPAKKSIPEKIAFLLGKARREKRASQEG